MKLIPWRETLIVGVLAACIGAYDHCLHSYSDKVGFFESAKNLSTGNYRNNYQCIYIITATSGNVITLEFVKFDLELSRNCSKDRLEITGRVKEALCGSNHTNYVVHGTRVMLNFSTDSSVSRAGFIIRYTTCGGKYNEGSGQKKYELDIASPNYAKSKYPNNAYCRYEVQSIPGFQIQMVFGDFSLENSTGCRNDNVTIYDGGRMIANNCGRTQSAISSKSSKVTVVFQSNSIFADKGFTMKVFTCSRYTEAKKGILTSPNFPESCDIGANCFYEIKLPAGSKIKLQFERFRLSTNDILLIKNDSDALYRRMTDMTYENEQEYGNHVSLSLKCLFSIDYHAFKLSYYDNQGACSKYKPCMNGAGCTDVDKLHDTYRCTCTFNFEGKNCTEKVAPCKMRPCLNGGTCTDVYSDSAAPIFKCHCSLEYRGQVCEHYIDGCTEYKTDARWQRSVSYNDAANFCDNKLQPSWYRFNSEAGPDMPTTCPMQNSCGTSGSIWINGTLPSMVGNETEMEACARNRASCCSASWDVRVKKCIDSNQTTYNVYRLKKPPSCPMAYCAGTELPCPPDYSSTNGFTPGCTETHPKILSSPKIYYTVNSSRLQFHCEFQSNAVNKTAMFEITWYEGRPFRKINQTDLVNGTDRMATLRNAHNSSSGNPLFRLGTTILCRVSSWYAQRPYGVIRGPTKESNHFFAGIKVQPQNLYIKESDEPLKLSVTATVPIICGMFNSCRIIASIHQHGTDSFTNVCAVTFYGGIAANRIHSVLVSAKRDFVNDGDQTVTMSFNITNGGEASDWINHHPVPSVLVIVFDVPSSMCTSYTDPYIKTFRGSKYFQYGVGDFLLVKSTKRIFEVHARTYQCGLGGSGVCNCGFAARDGDDVIVIDYCKGGPMSARFASKSQPANGTRLYTRSNARHYKIKFSSGVVIKIAISIPYGSHIDIKLPSDDYDTTYGACYNPIHRIPNGRSLFYYQGGKEFCQTEKPTFAEHFCICKKNAKGIYQNSCNHNSKYAGPEFSENEAGWTALLHPIIEKCNDRDKEIGTVLPWNEFFNYTHEHQKDNETEPQWPTASGITKNLAKRYCEKAIRNHPVAEACTNVANFSIESYVEACITNVLLTGGFNFTLSVIEAMQAECGEAILTGNDRRTNFTRTLCPGLCSGHGTCVNAVCVCDAEYTSIDCSIDRTKGPTLTSIRDGGLCDLRSRNDCHIVRIMGAGFMGRERLRCRSTKLKMSPAEHQPTPEQDLHKTELLSFMEVRCTLKGHQELTPNKVFKQGAYHLDVTNDGTIYSDRPVQYTIFDSTCMDCSHNSQLPMICKIKANTCSIDGICYSAGEVSEADKYSICNPKSSQIKFTKDHYPKLKSSPKIFPLVKNRRLAFDCQFQSETNETEARFEVTWYEGWPLKRINQTDILAGTERTATLQNKDSLKEKALFSLGKTIFCRVRAWYGNDSVANALGPTHESNHYFAGVKVEPQKQIYEVSESGKALKLNIIVTVPIVCQIGRSCHVAIAFDSSGSQIVLDRCLIRFVSGAANQSQIVKVTATRDFVVDRDQVANLRVKVMPADDPLHWNNHHKIPDVKVAVKDVDTRRCQSTGDPHISTFDGLYFNHYKVGTYLLTKSSCRDFEVHVRTHECSTVSCNCGVAAREGNDVIVIDFCNEKFQTARFASKGSPANGTKFMRDRTGKHFMIEFPSGSFVQFDVFPYSGKWYANIAVQIPSDDFNCTTGLCGIYDDSRSNDMTDKDRHVYSSMEGHHAPVSFTENWKLKASESLFYDRGYIGGVRATKKFCSCTSKSNSVLEDCSSNSNVNRPSYFENLKNWVELVSPYDKRVVKEDDDKHLQLPFHSKEVNYDYQPKQADSKQPTWPTKSGRTRAGVEAFCNTAIRNSTVGKVCSKIWKFPFDHYVQQCMDDIQITDTEEFTISAIHAMQVRCEELLLKNLTHWRRKPKIGEGIVAGNKTIYPPKETAFCPGSCSGNGECIGFECKCKEGFTSDDCSMNENTRPKITAVGTDGLCDVRERRDCHLVKIRGANFMEGGQLVCRATKIKISKKGYTLTKKTTTHKAKLLSFKEIYCDLGRHAVKTKGASKMSHVGQPFDGYNIELAYEGSQYTTSTKHYVIFDSKCMECDGKTAICKQKKNTCIKNGICLRDGENGYKCDDSGGVNKHLIKRKYTGESERLVAIISVSCFAGAVLIAAIVSIVSICRKKREERGKLKIESGLEETLALGRIDLSLFVEDHQAAIKKELGRISRVDREKGIVMTEGLSENEISTDGSESFRENETEGKTESVSSKNSREYGEEEALFKAVEVRTDGQSFLNENRSRDGEELEVVIKQVEVVVQHHLDADSGITGNEEKINDKNMTEETRLETAEQLRRASASADDLGANYANELDIDMDTPDNSELFSCIAIDNPALDKESTGEKPGSHYINLPSPSGDTEGQTDQDESIFYHSTACANPGYEES